MVDYIVLSKPDGAVDQENEKDVGTGSLPDTRILKRSNQKKRRCDESRWSQRH